MVDYSRVRSLIDQYSKPPKKPKIKPYGASTEPTFGELSLFEKGIDLVSRPMNAVASFADSVVKGRGNPFVEGIKGFAGRSRKSFGDVLHSAGFKKNIATGAMGLGLDVLLDPLTYVGVGPVKKAATVTVGGVAKHLTAEGASKVGELAKRASGAIVERLPQMSGAKLARTAEYASKQSRDVRTLLKGRTAAEMVTPESAKIIGQGLAQKPIRKLLEKSPELVAPTAIKFMGQPIIKTATIGKALAPVGKAVEKGLKAVPLVGKAVEPVKDFGKKAIGYGRAIFSGKTGNAEFDYLKTGERDARHLMDIESGEFAKGKVKEIREITGYDAAAPAKKKAVDQEINKFLEGIDQDRLIKEPSEQAKAIDKRVAEFERVTEKLAKMVEPFEVKEAAAKAGIKAAEVAKGWLPGKIAQSQALPEVQGKLKAEATAKAIKEAEESLRIAQTPGGGDALSMLDVDGTKIYLSEEWLAKTGSTKAAELRDAIPSKYLAGKSGKGQGLDALAGRLGVDSAEEAADLFIKAGLKRKADLAKIKALKGTKKELKAGVSSIEDIQVPQRHLSEVADKDFEAKLAKEGAVIEKRIADLNKAVDDATTSERRAILETQLELARGDLANWKAKKAGLKPEEATREVLIRERVDYEPKDPRVKALGQSIRERYKMMLEREQKVNPLLKERTRYAPHIMRPEIRDSFIDIIQHNPHQVMKSADLSAMSKHALQRSNEKGVMDVTINDLIRSGDIDVGKLRAELKKRGIEMDAFDESVFETDPIKAMLGRELAHNRAISAGQFIDEVLNSPAFNKGAVSVDALLRLRKSRGAERAGQLIEGADAEVQRIQKLLEQHQGTHSIFIPSPQFVKQFKTPADQLAMRQGHGEMIDLLKKLLDVDIEDYAAKVAKGELPAGAKGYILPNEIAEHLNKAHRFMFDDKRVSDFLRTFDKAQGWWKTFATVVRPAFHVRNLVSNLWQNHLAGVNDPQAYALAHAIQNEALRGKLAPIGGYTAEQVYRLAEANGVLKHGFIGSEIGEYLERSVSPNRNPFSTSGPVARFGQKVGTTIEDNARLANFIDGLKKGMDPASAAMRVKKYLFDYADLSEVEKSVFRRIAPFYTFTRKSIPLALETLVTQPGKVAVLGKARAEAEKSLESLNHEYVADYINSAFGIPVHKNAKGEFEYFLLKGYIPTVDLAKLDEKEILGMLSPAIKTPIEAFLNLDFYRMKPIRRFPTEMVEFMGVPMPVNAAHLLRNVVVMAQLDREIFREGATVGKGIASEFSFRTQTQNPVDQMRRYVLASQMEMGEMKRLAERARAEGKNRAAEQYEARLELLKARRDDAKAKTLKLDPRAFKFGKPKAAPKPSAMPDFRKIRDKIERDMRVENILKEQRRRAQ